VPLGGVNGLSPPRFTGWVFVPCDAPAFADPEFPDPGLIVPTECTLVLVGGVNGRNPPRFPACVGEDGLFTLRLLALFVDCRFEGVPGLGRCIVPCAATDPPFTRPPAENPFTWPWCMACCKCAVSCWNDAGRATLLCADPKKCSARPLRTVDGAAARPLADRLARDGTTGKLPAIMRAPPNCWRVTGDAVTRPAPKRPAPTVDMARMT
jgi:hypothetical protein